VIVVAGLVLALAAPSREALTQRWLHANPAHSLARLNAGPRAPASAAPAVADLHALVQRELAVAGRYQLSKPPASVAGESWWMRAWDWIAERWHRFWEALFGHARVGRAAAADIGDVLLVVVGLLLLYIVVRLAMGWQLARSQSRVRTSPLEDLPSPLALYNRACATAAIGDYGSAALLLFAATVALLDRQGAVDATSSATVGDLRRSLRAHNVSLLAPFDAVASAFVQRAYAERPVEASHWQRAVSAFDTLTGHA
jgi:hypothetical protein